MKIEKGMVLPLIIIISLVLLTSIGVWYRKIILQSFLSERLIQQRIAYKECNSLIPLLTKQLENVSEEMLILPDNPFLTIKSQGNVQWNISRSALINDKIVFVFKSPNQSQEPLRLTIGYSLSKN